MQTAMIPQIISKTIHRMNRNFLWGDTRNHSFLWDMVTRSKEEGGLNIKKKKEKKEEIYMNIAMLTNQAWNQIAWPLQQHEETRTMDMLKHNHTSMKDLTLQLPDQTKDIIKGIPIAQFHSPQGKLVWSRNNGICSVNSAYKFLHEQ